MLEGELDIGTESEVAVFSSETPDQRTSCGVDLVDGVGVAGGDEVGAGGVFVDGVDVEIIPGVGTVVA